MAGNNCCGAYARQTAATGANGASAACWGGCGGAYSYEPAGDGTGAGDAIGC